MRDKLYNNADSFAMSFDEEWENVDCDDLRLKIDKVLELLSDHPFLISNPENARKMAEFRIFSCLLYTSPSPRDGLLSRMPSSA